ncbi:PAS domain S-box protein [Algoriphagus antarcticus]|uniref:histidine kinase n=1 Tax=Algoriphagus antarcticus TaxID=238540 RepID=A0A3E0DI43_9BACT|nr:PAS domain S-box protein [Algoriphagus antarcticus]REG82309.1 PAS domain S-box-containing protein [Algoriphagus antarcticus]
MEQTQLTNTFLDQSKDLFWIVNLDFQLIYANKRYLSLMKEVTGVEKKLNESVLVEGFGEELIEKWKAYYSRALKGEYFEIEEHHAHPETNEIRYGQITLEPLRGDDHEVFAVACLSRDITRVVKQKSEANQMIDSSLGVFCTIDYEGNFVYVSAASEVHWGYLPEELVGKAYQDLILEEDLLKTSEIASAILSGREVKSFVNRYKKKNGGIAYNLWSVRWDGGSKLMYCVARDAKERIEEEEIIQQSEQRFKALVQQGSDLIGILDGEGNYIYVSPTSTSVLGIAPEEFIGRNALEFIHPDDVERTSASLQKIATESRLLLEPYRVQNHQKEWRWFETVFTNMLDNPAVKGIVGNSRDITEKIEEKHKLKSVSAIANIGYWRLELDRNTLSWTDEVYTIWGRQKESFELNYESFIKTIHPADLPLFEKDQELAYQGLTPHNQIHRIILPDHQIRWVHELGRLVKDEDGKSIAFEGTVQDVTKQKEEEQRLKLLESVITNTNDAVLITEAEPFDEPGPRIIYVNAAFSKMTGYEAHEVIGKSPRMLQGPNSNKKELAKLGRALRNWEPYEITTINYKKTGEEFWTNFTVNPVANEKGWYTHWIAIERDVTDQKTKELEKDLINEISGIFNQSTDHDLTACLTKLCQHITKFGDFDFGEIWLPAIDANTINRVANCFKNKAGNDFYEASRNSKSLVLGEGMPGYVWENKQTEIWGNGDKEWLFFKRKEAAKKAGIEVLMGVPLKHNEVVIGVLLLGTGKAKAALALYSELLQKLESTIGTELSRKKLEIELAQIFDFTPDIICVAGFDGYLKRINPAGLELLGYSLEEMRSRPIRSFVHEDDRLQTKEQQTQLYNGGRQTLFENRYITKAGKIVWLSWTATSAPEHGIVYAVAKNVTEEKVLRELNREAGKLARIGSWEMDLINQDGDGMYWSPMIREILELDDSYNPTLTGGIEFHIGESKERIQKALDLLIKDGTEFDEEILLLTAKGHERWSRVIGKSEIVNNKRTKIYGSYQDIHASKSLELKISEILGSISDAFYALDKDWNFTYFNREAERLLQTSEKEAIGKNKWELFPSTVGTKLYEVYHRITQTLVPETFEYLYPADGKWYEVSAYPSAGGLSVYFKNIDERKLAAENLQKAFEEKNKILESIGDAFFAVDCNWIVTYWNKEAELILGKKKEQIVGKNLWEENTYSIDSDFYHQYHEAMNTGEAVNFESFSSTMNKWLEVSAYPAEEGLSVYFKDVTSRKETDIQLHQANERFEKVTEATNDAIWDWDMVNQTYYRSKAIERFFGKKALKSFTENDFWKDNFHPEDFEKIQISINEAISNPLCNRLELEYRVFNEHGKTLYVIDRGVIIRNSEGKAIRMVGAMTDVTEQKKSEEANRFKANLLSMIGQAAIATNLDGVVNYWNKAAENIYGWKQEEAIGENIMHLTVPDISKEQAIQIMDALKKGETWLGKFKVCKKDRTNFPALISNSPIFDENNKLSGIIGISSDITQEIKTEELLKQYTLELERSNEDLEQFAFVASHDLQEPLRMIASFMDLLKRKYGDLLDEKGHQYIHFATDGAKSMKQIILDLLEYSRANRPTEGKKEVDLNEVLSEFGQLRRKLISEKSASIKSSELPILFTYKAAITQILHCLIDNSLKYCKADIPPKVEIDVVENEKEWEFSIKDNGIGMDPQFYDKIFVIFQRLHNKDQYSGTGLGLSVAKRHVEFLGGRIWLESESGVGTVFYFTIPKIK